MTDPVAPLAITHRTVHEREMLAAVKRCRTALRRGEAAARSGDFTTAYAQFEEAQDAAFDAKDLFGLNITRRIK